VTNVTFQSSNQRRFEPVLRLIFSDCNAEFTTSKSSCDLPHGGAPQSYL